MTVFTGSSCFSELKEIKGTLKWRKQIKGIKKFLQRNDLISKVKQSNDKLSTVLQTFQVSLRSAICIVCFTCPPQVTLAIDAHLAQHAERLKVHIHHISSQDMRDE